MILNPPIAASRNRVFFFCLIALILFCDPEIFSQSSNPSWKHNFDSLNALLRDSRSQDTSKVFALYEMGRLHELFNVDTGIVLVKEGLALSEKINYRRGKEEGTGCLGMLYHRLGKMQLVIRNDSMCIEMARKSGNKLLMAVMYLDIGGVYQSAGNNTRAMDCFNKSMTLSEDLTHSKNATTVRKAKTELGNSYETIGTLYYNEGNIARAMEYYHRGLKFFEELSAKAEMSKAYTNLGIVHLNQNETELALSYFKRGTKLREEIGDKFDLSFSYNGLGLAYMNLANSTNDKSRKDSLYEVSLSYYQKGLKVTEETSDLIGMGASYNNLALIYNKRKDYAKAIHYMEKSIEVYNEASSVIGVVKSLSNLGKLHVKSAGMPGFSEAKALENARDAGERGLKMGKQAGFAEGIELCAELLAKVAKKQGKWKDALEMYELFIHMRDSIDSERALKVTAQQQAKYEYEKKEAMKDTEHAREMGIASEEKKRQQVIIYSVSGGLLLMLVLAGVVFTALQSNRKKNRIISVQKAEVEDQKSKLELVHHQLANHHKEIQDSIHYARRIQSAVLPSVSSMSSSLKDGFVLYKPKDVVAGDFFWMEEQNGKVYYAAADCTGHGVPGAMMSVVCSNALSDALQEHTTNNTGQLLDRTREAVIQKLAKSGEEVRDGMDISLCAIDFTHLVLQWSGANNPLWIIRNGELIEFKPDKQPIGAHILSVPFASHDMQIRTGDLIYVFTDGFEDQFGGPKGKKYKAAQMKEKLLSISNLSMDEQRDFLDKEFERWKGDAEQVDDVCMIGVRIN